MADRSGRRGIARYAAVVMGLAVLIGGVALVRIAFAAFPTIAAPSFPIPGTTSAELEPGRYAVFERTGTSRQVPGVSVSFNGSRSLRPDDVVVTAPSGSEVDVRTASGVQTIQRDGEIYTAAVEFTATETGRYQVVAGGDAESGSAVVGRDLGDLFASLLPWVIATGACAVVAGVAFVVFLVSLFRTAARKRRAMPPVAGPPGAWPPAPA